MSPASGGGPTIFLPLLLICIIGAVVIIGAFYARRKGRLRSRGAIVAIVLLVVLLAFVAWVAPSLPAIFGSSG
ncbi:MAG: hypothetical protein JWN69_1364 [Alphaproteobacteria bacterium]|nr:hypothetical protein [Alphaproteobacteria bacterium]